MGTINESVYAIKINTSEKEIGAVTHRLELRTTLQMMYLLIEDHYSFT